MQHRPSARDLGIPFDGQPGPHNSITDVPGVEVGHTTLIEGHGPLVIGKGPIRTGVTAIHPLGKEILGSVAAGWFPFNGNGEMTGTTWIEESGCLEGPILLTNTVSIGTVRDAVIKWARKKQEAAGTFNPNEYGLTLALPIVAETWDGGLNDIFGFHVREEHVDHALDTAQPGPVPQGNVGGGTGMTCYDFKGGIGTSSRLVSCYGRSPDRAINVVSRSPNRDTTLPSPQPLAPSPYVVGVLIQANHGNRSDLLIRGVPVGRELPLSEIPHYRDSRKSSILIIIGTDAPLLPQQLKRLARRATLGLGRTGTIGNNSSGDIFLAFSTARGLSPFAKSAEQKGTVPFSPVLARSPDRDSTPSPLTGEGRGEGAASPGPWLPNADLDPLFEATTEATEEANINALVAAETMTGRDHHTAHALPHPRLQEIMRKYNRL